METDITKLAEYFSDEKKAIELIERLRWPGGPVCPHCESKKAYRLRVKSSRRKLWKCAKCRKQFSVMVGTIFEDSHIPLKKWLVAIYLMCSSKKGISANQLHRSLKLTYKSTWFMCHRIRYAMSQPLLADKLKGIIEADETYIGGKARGTVGRGADKKVPVLALIERGGGARSFLLPNVGGGTIRSLIKGHVEIEAEIMTDQFPSYKGLGKHFADHHVVEHGKQYVRGIVHTNFAESYFSLLKRGIMGTFHHVSEKHLPFYLAEFDFRWNERELLDGDRTAEAIKCIEGKRLTYKQPRKRQNRKSW